MAAYTVVCGIMIDSLDHHHDRVVFDGSDLSKAIFTNAVLSGTTFTDANLKDTDFTDSYLGIPAW
jgi:uncharacterized protein YjbI with pentapeptide repeats